MSGKKEFDDMVNEVEAGLARFVAALRATDHNDRRDTAALFRSLEDISRESAEVY